MRKILSALTAAGCTLTCMAAGEVPLKVYSGARDTVTTDRQVIICVTDPAAKARVNGSEVKVFRTGSFGSEVQLKEGDNTVTIEVERGGDRATKTLDIYRAEPKHRTSDPDRTLRAEATSQFADPVYVESTEGAYLQYGNGDDRLGGSKMGFIAPGIRLKAVGEKGSLYKVALSATRFAYIPKSYTKASAAGPVPVVNTGNWRVSDTGRSDRVSISLPVRLPYRYWTEIDPSTICVELYGATDNSNWLVQDSYELGMIDYVYFEQPESDVYKVIIRLKDRYQWGFSVDYSGNMLTIDVRHRPSDISMRGLKVGLDAGHGGQYPGAISPSGIKEKDVNLDIILKLRDLLEKAGATVVLTREGDTGPSMAERKRTLREAGVDIALSVHNNAGGSALSPMGTSTYYKHLFDRPMAKAVLGRMLGLGLKNFGLTGNFNFSLNGPTDYPNILVECMFMSNLQEEEQLGDEAFRSRIARAIYDGMEDYLKEVRSSLKR